MDQRPFVLVPLYIYPLARAWEPLLEAARAHDEVDFMAVINPANGPGAGVLPDESYRAALGRLAAQPNISTLGYVYCSYGEREAGDVEADMDVYRDWALHGGPDVAGVFLDEAPSDPARVEYMATLAAHAKQSWRREATVVFNPGVVVGPGFFFRGADYVVVFEASQRQWDRLRRRGHDLRVMDAGSRPKAVAIVHSSDAAAAKVIKQARALGMAGVYLTDQLDGGYTRWPAAWREFAKAVSRC